MKTLLKALGAIVIPLSIGIGLTELLIIFGLTEHDAKDYGLILYSMTYVMYLYEVRFIKPGFNL